MHQVILDRYFTIDCLNQEYKSINITIYTIFNTTNNFIVQELLMLKIENINSDSNYNIESLFSIYIISANRNI